jgi:alkanesulfonate monooxygenase SsuD/methylene tetrahydromethanopterin reductase-like flavin-dependent oxidoreductase (luciferase family)
VERRGAVSPAKYQAADLAGTPDQVLEQLAAYAEVGADRAYLRLLDLRDVEQIELLGAAVLPGVPGVPGVPNGPAV